MKQADELLQRLISQKDFSLKRLCSDYMPWVRAIHEGDKNIPESLTEYAYKYSTHPEFRSMTRHEPRVIAELMKFMHRLVRWNQFGMPVFRIDEALFSRLLLTDPSNVNPASIKPPFQTFVFTVPTGYWASDDGDGRVVSLNTNWVHNSTSISQEEAVRANRYQEIVGLPQQGLVEFVSQGGIIMLYDTTSKISEKTDLPKWLTDLSKNKPAPFQIDETRYDKEIHAAVRRVYVNLCLYIADRGKGERLPQKLEKARKKRARKRNKDPDIQPNTWLLGRELKLDRYLCDAAKAWVDSTQGKPAAWKLRSQCVVRGHFKNQAYGPERSLRKEIWVEPYKRGPEEGRMIQHLYKAEDKDEPTHGRT